MMVEMLENSRVAVALVSANTEREELVSVDKFDLLRVVVLMIWLIAEFVRF